MPSIPFEVDTSTPTSPSNSAEPAGPPKPPVWTVSKLTRHIRLAIEGNFRSLHLEGELSNVKTSPQGHVYFVLKDEQSQIKGILFRSAAQALKFDLKDGLTVIAKGHITVYEPRGEYQIQVSSMEPKGVGALQLAFEQLKAKLHQEGLFDPARKKQRPYLPQRIGIITSPTGAVIRDMLNVHHRRFPGIPILFAPAMVQGDGAVPSIVEALELFNTTELDPPVDLIIVGRGGGSIEDLWAFNDEAVARAIAASKIPVISAVGHETDFTIADFVADLRAPTPSAAMEQATPSQADLIHTLQQRDQRLGRTMRHRLDQQSQLLELHLSKLKNPDFIVHQYTQQVDDCDTRLRQQMQQSIDEQRSQQKLFQEKLTLLNPKNLLQQHRTQQSFQEQQLWQQMQKTLKEHQQKIAAKASLLQSLSPLKVLERGYSVATDDQGKPLRSTEQVKPDDTIFVTLPDGKLTAQVTDCEESP